MNHVWRCLAFALALFSTTQAHAYDRDDRVGARRRTTAARYDGPDFHIIGVRPEVHLSIGGFGDIGAGFRLDIPVVPEGFLRNGRDEFALSPGLDVQFFDLHRGDRCCGPDPFPAPGPGPGPAPRPGPGRGPRHHDNVLVIPQLAAQWNIYFPRHAWSIFPEAGLAIVIGDWDGDDRVRVEPLVAFGARKHFDDRIALVMRVGWPSGFQIGLAF